MRYLLISGIKPWGVKRNISNINKPIVMSRICAALSSRCIRNGLPASSGKVMTSISHKPSGSLSTQKNQITKPPNTEPKLFPEPPTITMIQIKNVKRSGR